MNEPKGIKLTDGTEIEVDIVSRHEKNGVVFRAWSHADPEKDIEEQTYAIGSKLALAVEEIPPADLVCISGWWDHAVRLVSRLGLSALQVSTGKELGFVLYADWPQVSAARLRKIIESPAAG